MLLKLAAIFMTSPYITLNATIYTKLLPLRMDYFLALPSIICCNYCDGIRIYEISLWRHSDKKSLTFQLFDYIKLSLGSTFLDWCSDWRPTKCTKASYWSVFMLTLFCFDMGMLVCYSSYLTYSTSSVCDSKPGSWQYISRFAKVIQVY